MYLSLSYLLKHALYNSSVDSKLSNTVSKNEAALAIVLCYDAIIYIDIAGIARPRNGQSK